MSQLTWLYFPSCQDWWNPPLQSLGWDLRFSQGNLASSCLLYQISKKMLCGMQLCKVPPTESLQTFITEDWKPQLLPRRDGWRWWCSRILPCACIENTEKKWMLSTFRSTKEGEGLTVHSPRRSFKPSSLFETQLSRSEIFHWMELFKKNALFYENKKDPFYH